MHARELFQAGRLDEAIASLGVELRSNPTDAQRRAFLFELLSFAGNHDRAEKQLDVLAGASAEAGIGALTLKAALQADRLRSEMFATGNLPSGPAPRPVSGTLNGQPFTTLEDADPRIGARLEVFAGGQYLWLPLEHVATVRMERPARLRDLLWAPAKLLTGPGFRGLELGDVLLPVLTPLAAQHADPQVQLGRVTAWEELPDGQVVPAGQKLLLVDGEEVPLLEVRELVITPEA
ncbi:MAG TPA: type VI secretion system accessory protein TagJ [Gemmatimonadaceae bacterium]|nr:type VI secretion system accessory protein TagJ [Gemmatimonadaceae bacterium]